AAAHVEERPIEGALELEQDVAGDERWEREQDHRADHEHIPGVERREMDAHARRAAAEHPDDELDGGGDRGDFDEGEPEQPEVRPEIALIRTRERRIHEPSAARRDAEEEARAEEHAADGEAPE